MPIAVRGKNVIFNTVLTHIIKYEAIQCMYTMFQTTILKMRENGKYKNLYKIN